MMKLMKPFPYFQLSWQSHKKIQAIQLWAVGNHQAFLSGLVYVPIFGSRHAWDMRWCGAVLWKELLSKSNLVLLGCKVGREGCDAWCRGSSRSRGCDSVELYPTVASESAQPPDNLEKCSPAERQSFLDGWVSFKIIYSTCVAWHSVVPFLACFELCNVSQQRNLQVYKLHRLVVLNKYNQNVSSRSEFSFVFSSTHNFLCSLSTPLRGGWCCLKCTSEGNWHAF